MYNIIAICGAKRSGKDVLAKYLINKYKYEKLSFAEPLKKAVKELFNFNDIQVGIDEDNGIGNEKDIIDERWGITPRKALQFFGTEIMQYKINELIPNTNRGFFADILVSRIIPNKKYVISDLRFLHEYEKIKELNIIIIKVIRPSIINQCMYDDHISENEYEKIPCIDIINKGSIEDYIENFELLNKYYKIIDNQL
jgi:dephospho-CoA kinase